MLLLNEGLKNVSLHLATQQQRSTPECALLAASPPNCSSVEVFDFLIEPMQLHCFARLGELLDCLRNNSDDRFIHN